MPKVVITTVPFIDENTPLLAPAVLKSALEMRGIECVGLDLNIDIYNKIQHDPRRQKFLDFFYYQIIDDEIVDDIVRILDFYCCEILSHEPDIIGLSLFSYNSQVFAAWLCAALRHTAPDKKIFIGGPGLQTLENTLYKYPDRLKKSNLIDDYITGDGETSVVEYVLGNTSYPGINSTNWIPNRSLDDLPLANFGDYRFFKYQYEAIPIIDSRGCVQNCEFCDVIAFWEKFQYRTAETLFAMMQHYINEYNIYRFQFASSICNGNLKEFKKLVQMIADYNDRHNEERHIHWLGSFIVRSATNHPEWLWQLIKKSNGFLLTGVESIIEHVRIKLGKNFTNEDLDYHLQMTKKYQISTNLLFIAAYPTETDEDYQAAKQWFIDHKEFANNTVEQVQLTLPTVLPGTRLESTINLDKFNADFRRRQKQANELDTVIKSCGFKTRTFF